MALITIARQLGAAGETVATQLADELGWRLLDRALVERIADELAIAPHEVEALNERVETFLERLGSYLSDGLPEVLPAPIAPPLSPELTARAARLVVASVAEEGPAVIVGHGAQCVLEGHPGALHVLLYAQLEVRAARAGEHYGLSDDEASERIRESDAQRRAYIREHFDREWLDPTLYHLALDTGSLGVEGAVELIRRAAARTLGGG